MQTDQHDDYGNKDDYLFKTKVLTDPLQIETF